MNKSKTFILVMILMVSCTLQDTKNKMVHPEASASKPRDLFIEMFDSFIQSQLDTCHCPGAAVTVITDSTTRLLKGYGYRSMQDSLPVNENTVFRLASVSKNISALLAAVAIQENKLQYNDLVKTHLPDFGVQPKLYAEQITIEHILSQSSGLPYHSYTNRIEQGASILSLITSFNDITISVPPGKDYAYQNASFALIEPLLEKVYLQSFTTLMDQKIKIPLGMNNMSYCIDSIQSCTNHAEPHDFHRDCQCIVHTGISNKYYNTISAGGINASIEDMNKWLRVLMGHRPDIISDTALAYYFKPMIKSSHDRRYYNFWPGVKDTYYAHGMRVLDYGDHYKYYHGGFANDYRAEIAIDPKNKIAICALFNSTCCLSDFIVPALFQNHERWMQNQHIQDSIRSSGNTVPYQ